ncbi:MAG TPA: hypothetical protein ENH82_09765, partial [bacterium]|nr:hypothetical protein [bacterium]
MTSPNDSGRSQWSESTLPTSLWDMPRIFFSSLSRGYELTSALTKSHDRPQKQVSQKRYTLIKDIKTIKTLPPMPDIFIKIEKLAHDPKSTSAHYG